MINGSVWTQCIRDVEATTEVTYNDNREDHLKPPDIQQQSTKAHMAAQTVYEIPMVVIKSIIAPVGLL